VSPHNDPLIKALYNSLPNATNAEAAELGLAMQRVIRGENLDDINPEAARLYRQYMAEIDATAEQYEKNKEDFITDAHDSAVRLTDKEKVKYLEIAKEKQSNFRAQARMKGTQKKQWMIDQLKNGPKEEIYVEPVVEIGRIGDSPAQQIVGQRITINGVSLYLPPGKNTVHPIFAERYRQIQQSRNETTARKEVLKGVGIDPTGGKRVLDGWQQTALEMERINREYGSSSGSGEGGDSWQTPELHGSF